MKKLFWLLVAAALCFGSVLFYNPSVNKAQAAGYIQQKKKNKKNYRSLSNFTVSGDQTNGDAAVVQSSASPHSTWHYRRVAVPGLRMADPPSFCVYKQNASTEGFTEENWSGTSNYFITDGYLWLIYGYYYSYGGTTSYVDIGSGNYRYYNYYGGAKAKKRKRQAVKTYSFSASGNENNADAAANSSTVSSTLTYYYRKVAVPELETGNLVDYRIYRKNAYYSGFSDESWSAASSIYYFINEGYLYMAYGYKYPDSQFYEINNGDFRLFIYSDGKRKKSRLKKQYAKRYAFNVPAGEGNADKISSSTNIMGITTSYYYKKVSLPGVRTNNAQNIRLIKKQNFVSGGVTDSWSQGSYNVTDGYIWVNYAMRFSYSNETSTYFDTGSGDYRLFLYK